MWFHPGFFTAHLRCSVVLVSVSLSLSLSSPHPNVPLWPFSCQCSLSFKLYETTVDYHEKEVSGTAAMRHLLKVAFDVVFQRTYVCACVCARACMCARVCVPLNYAGVKMATLAPQTITESTNESTTIGRAPSGFPSSCQSWWRHRHTCTHTHTQAHTYEVTGPKDTYVVSHLVNHPNRPFWSSSSHLTCISTKRALAEYY